MPKLSGSGISPLALLEAREKEGSEIPQSGPSKLRRF
jgi:hypothetical protein